jgi:hypothetical protein
VDAASAAFNDFAPPQGDFRTYASFAAPIPSTAGYPAYGRGLDEATGQIIQNPSTSVSAAIATIKSTVGQALPGQTEVQK